MLGYHIHVENNQYHDAIRQLHSEGATTGAFAVKESSPNLASKFQKAAKNATSILKRFRYIAVFV